MFDDCYSLYFVVIELGVVKKGFFIGILGRVLYL